jgi:hypothetical protein
MASRYEVLASLIEQANLSSDQEELAKDHIEILKIIHRDEFGPYGGDDIVEQIFNYLSDSWASLSFAPPQPTKEVTALPTTREGDPQ